VHKWLKVGREYEQRTADIKRRLAAMRAQGLPETDRKAVALFKWVVRYRLISRQTAEEMRGLTPEAVIELLSPLLNRQRLFRIRNKRPVNRRG
jgi:hypothetical protein